MASINKIGLQLPIIGQSGNWGRAVNQNFNIIGDEINKIYNNMNTLQYLIGANVPYIKVDEEQYFVIISCLSKEITENGVTLPTGSYILRYYKKDNSIRESVITTPSKTYYLSAVPESSWRPAIPTFVGAYVVGFDNDYQSEINYEDLADKQESPFDSIFENFVRGDLIVPVPEFGSIYGDNLTINFKKYPSSNEYYTPIMPRDEPYLLQFDKQNYVDWFRKKSLLEYKLPTIGMGSFNTFLLSEATNDKSSKEGNQWTIIIGPISAVDNLSSPQINWFYQEPPSEDTPGEEAVNPFISAFVAFSWAKDIDPNTGEETFTITADISNISGGDLRCEVYFLHNNNINNTSQSDIQEEE